MSPGCALTKAHGVAYQMTADRVCSQLLRYAHIHTSMRLQLLCQLLQGILTG